MKGTMMLRKITALGAALVVVGSLAACSGGGSPTETSDSNEPVTLNYVWWGNDDRATRMNEAIALFEEDHPNVTINGSFTDFNAYWEKRSIEAAGGGLPDVMAFAITYVREYAENGQLLDLGPYEGEALDMSTLPETLLPAGKIDDTLYSVPMGTNSWSVIYDPAVFEQYGIALPEERPTWDEYQDLLREVHTASGGAVYGSNDYITHIRNFDQQLRQEDSYLLSPDGELGFDQDRLEEFWSSTQDVVEEGALVPETKMAEVAPRTAVASKLAPIELAFDNTIAAAVADSGVEGLQLMSPPTDHPKTKDLYLSPSSMVSASAKTEHPQEAAQFIDFMVNDPRVGKIFGTSRGVPASSSAREGAELTGLDALVADYEESLADVASLTPEPDAVGYSSLESTFARIGSEVAFGRLSAEDAAAEFLSEADVILNQ